jgi:hypothetical protein
LWPGFFRLPEPLYGMALLGLVLILWLLVRAKRALGRLSGTRELLVAGGRLRGAARS